MKLIFYLAGFTFLLFSCNNSHSDDNVLILAVASSAQLAMHDIARSFEKEYNCKVSIINGASGRLVTQIINGAPFDLFVSANEQYANYLFHQKKTDAKPVIIGYGALVIFSNSPIKALSELEIGQSKIAIASPKHAPYGQQAVQFLQDKGLYVKLKPRLIFAENIAQVNEYIQLQTVQFGITSKISLPQKVIATNSSYYELDKKYALAQSVVAIKNKKSKKIKQAFISFLQSNKGQKILIKNGYSLKKI